MFTSEDGANILSDLSRRLSALSSRPNWYLERTSEWGFLLLSAIDTCEEEAEMVLDFEKDELCEIEESWGVGLSKFGEAEDEDSGDMFIESEKEFIKLKSNSSVTSGL